MSSFCKACFNEAVLAVRDVSDLPIVSNGVGFYHTCPRTRPMVNKAKVDCDRQRAIVRRTRTQFDIYGSYVRKIEPSVGNVSADPAAAMKIRKSFEDLGQRLAGELERLAILEREVVSGT